MRWRLSLPLLAVVGANHVDASHAHLRHGHARAHLKRANILAPESIIEEVHTRTQTTTVYEYEACIPTNTINITTTVLGSWFPEPTIEQGRIAHFDKNTPSETTSEPSGVHFSTTVTGTVPVSVGVDVDEPARAILNPAVEARPAPEPATTVTTQAPPPPPTTTTEAKPRETKETEPATTATNPQPPQLLPLPNLPDLLPATALPPLPDLHQALSPGDPSLLKNLEWTALPAHDKISTKGFGGRSKPNGTEIKYHGNSGIPWGSNIIRVSPTSAHEYKYVVQFRGANQDPWTITIWNKMGPDGKLDGWYGNSALTFVLAPGETRYVAFDEDSEGAWGAAPGTDSLPTDHWGGYTSTWGEFSFGDEENKGWSGWDVSAIQAQIAKQDVQGMRICQVGGRGCSVITPRAKKVVNAYTEDKKHHDGIGGAAAPGPVRLVVDIDYRE